ncbi:MAG: hypothetical protein EP343_29555 [Deltaproteobacteria bacterium]|nr:MAG: hypothetical protein EP343_29555 [Deltaproteobacteria bacterium]
MKKQLSQHKPARWWRALLALTLWIGMFAACGGNPDSNNQNNNNATNTNENNSTGNTNTVNENNNTSNQNNQNENTNENNQNVNSNTNEPPPIPGEMKPKVWGSLQLSARTYPLPDAMKDDKSFVMTLMGQDIWIGGKSGLYRWSNGSFVKIHEKPVVGLVVWEVEKGSMGLLVGRPDGIDLWFKQTMEPSSLNYKLAEKEEIRVLTSRGAGDLWIGSNVALRQWKEGKLLTYDTFKGVTSIFTYPNAKELLVTTNEGTIVAMREDGDGWATKALESEVKDHKMDQIVPWKEGQFWGLSGDTLFFRKKTEENTAWWPFRLRNGEDASKDWTPKAITFDPDAGAVWVWAQQGILRLDESEARELVVKEKPSQLLHFHVEADTALWWSDGKTLTRVGQEGPPVTYAKDVKPFVEQSCLKCHKQGGIAEFLQLDTYDSVRKNITRMIFRIESKETPMPPPPDQLVGGDAETLRRWIQGGYRQ